MIAVRKDRILFIQIKSNKKHISSAIKEFEGFEIPSNSYKIVVTWEDRAKKPIIRKA